MLEINEYGDVIQIRMSREWEGKPLYWVAAYLVDGLLIDTGCAYTAAELVEFLVGKRLDMVVNTHFHEDHVGGDSMIQERFSVPIYAAPAAIPSIAGQPFLFPYQEFVWGRPAPASALPVPPVITTPLYAFDVIATPGHADGHVVLLEKNRGWCFSGDIFAREAPKFIRPEEDMGETIRSLERILAAAPPHRLTLFTSLGRIVADGRTALEANIRYLRELARKARALQRQGCGEEEIVTELFGGEHLFARMTDGQYTTANLIRSVLRMTD
ncbi:MAG: MBL fold metallo-hydrolase [Pseudomonadota bacterium]|nr:MBL fold metallo-hydrolase [Pseudomonadota bacterium]